MTNTQPNNEVAVDRVAETIVTQQPGYASTEQITTDNARERRLWFMQVDRILYTGLGLLEILLGLRFLLKLIAANTQSGFTQFVYGLSGLFVAPFNNLIGTPMWGDAAFEATTLIAMAMYALLFWVLVRVIGIATAQTSARSVTRSTHEVNPRR
jgi:hypothetical protein